jgi:hypothetical protein
MAEMPTCSTCNKPHWRFTACADAPAPPRPDAYPVKSVPEGYHVFGDKLSTRDRNG